MDQHTETPSSTWQYSTSGLPLPPKPLGKMSEEEWQAFVDAFLSCARTKAADRQRVT